MFSSSIVQVSNVVYVSHKVFKKWFKQAYKMFEKSVNVFILQIKLFWKWYSFFKTKIKILIDLMNFIFKWVGFTLTSTFHI